MSQPKHLFCASTGWRVAGCAVNWEDTELRCDHSGERIPAAYGESEDENEQD